MAATYLVCGGAGYIGAHVCEALAAAGADVVVFDDLSAGRRAFVGGATLIEGDLCDAAAIEAAVAARRYDGVVHLAGRIVVGESVRDPGAYYRVNVLGTLNLLQALARHGAPPLVFSSTAALYGVPRYTPIDEDHPLAPINPYGHGKRMVEEMLADFDAAHGLASVSLRYFNAAGASASGRIGEAHEPETHLVPNVLRAALAGTPVDVFGTDWPTPDGSCVRDYVHVADLARAHVAALHYLDRGGTRTALNLGSGRGHSVLEVIAAAEAVTGRRIERRAAPRRAGDPPVLVASAARAAAVLGWRPESSDLATIVASAWAWERGGRAPRAVAA